MLAVLKAELSADAWDAFTPVQSQTRLMLGSKPRALPQRNTQMQTHKLCVLPGRGGLPQACSGTLV